MAARLLDSLIAGVIPWLVILLGAGVMQLGTPAHHTDDGFTATQIPGLIILLAGVAGLFLVPLWVVWENGRGATVGKKVMKVRLLDENTGQPVGFVGAFIRDILMYVFSLGLLIGYLWPLWDPKNRALADKVLGYVVVRDHSTQPQTSGTTY